jgi:tyrosine-specific transport protein
MIDKKFILALAILIGTIVGAGIFGIPYVMSRSGLIPSFFYFIIFGFVILFLHLFFGEIVLRTNEKFRLIGYAEKYLGKGGKIIITISTLIGIGGSLLAYIILGGNFLKIIFSPILKLSSFNFSIIFWAILIYFIFHGVKMIAKIEVLTNLSLLFIFFLVVFAIVPRFEAANFNLINPKDMFLPYGVIMFALVGFMAIPEMIDILKTPEDKKSLKNIIIVASLVVIIFYLIFSLGIVGVSGGKTSQEALSGLIPYLGKRIIILGALFGAINIADSFLVICLYLKNTLIYDYRFSKNLAFLIAVGLPLIMFLAGFRNFIQVIGFLGTFLGTIEGIVILLIYEKAKKLGNRTPEYSLNTPTFLTYFFILLFILGAISQTIYSF